MAKAKTTKSTTKTKKTPAKTTKAKTPSKKTSTKKTSTKKPSAKKPAAKKTTAKAPAAKKTTTKTTAKKATTKKTTAKKTATKTTTKAAASPKPAAKKVVAKKVVAKKVTGSSTSSKPTKVVPVVLGKHGRKTYPEGSLASDFQCFGPPATKDGEFNHARICDMGCFKQDGQDSNKYYHAAVVQQKDSKNWYAYFEWGRTGATSPDFQFVGCRDEADAVSQFAKQLHSKNDRRGEWVTIAGIRTLRAKKGKDCYLVRPQATRSTGLPDARSIKMNEGAKEEKRADSGAKKKRKKAPSADPQTLSLMKDLAMATVAYTKGSMADQSLPTQTAIDEARDILQEALKQIKKIGDNEAKQLKDKQLMDMTSLMYGRIPKRKPVGAAASTWVLSQDNILRWQADLDAFESALYSTDIIEDTDFDPFAGMNLKMEWVSPDSKIGKYLYEWWPKATNNRHGYIKNMKIKNLWQVERHADVGKIAKAQAKVLEGKPKIKERPLFQKPRPDLSKTETTAYKNSNTSLLFHGTRSVNVSGILREALRLPKTLVGVVITGAMFGPGIYFADDWKKSAGYTSLQHSYYAAGSGQVKGRGAFMFACDVVLGAPYVAPKWGGYTGPPKGFHSIYGKSGTSGVQNNEFIVFEGQQNQLRYLCEFVTK